MFKAKPSKVNGYWKDTLDGNSFYNKIFLSTTIFTLLEMNEKSKAIVWCLSLRAIYQQ